MQAHKLKYGNKNYILLQDKIASEKNTVDIQTVKYIKQDFFDQLKYLWLLITEAEPDYTQLWNELPGLAVKAMGIVGKYKAQIEFSKDTRDKAADRLEIMRWRNIADLISAAAETARNNISPVSKTWFDSSVTESFNILGERQLRLEQLKKAEVDALALTIEDKAAIWKLYQEAKSRPVENKEYLKAKKAAITQILIAANALARAKDGSQKLYNDAIKATQAAGKQMDIMLVEKNKTSRGEDYALYQSIAQSYLRAK